MEIQKYFEIIENIFLQHRSLIPMLLVHTSEGENIFISFLNLPQKKEDKQIMMFRIGKRIAEDKIKIDWVIFSSEAMLKYASNKQDKKEGFISVYNSKDNKCQAILKEIIRKEGRIELKNIEIEKIEIPLLKEFWSGYIFGGGK